MGYIADSIRVRHDPAKANTATPSSRGSARYEGCAIADHADGKPLSARTYATAEMLSRGFTWCDWDPPDSNTWGDIYNRLMNIARELEDDGQ